MVLWTTALLAMIGIRLLTAGRTDIQVSATLINALRVEAAADGAVNEAIVRLADGAALHWPADNVPRMTRVGRSPVLVTIENLAGRINPNTAPAELIAALLIHLGVPSEPAGALGAAVFDWHMPGPIASPGGAKRPAYRSAGLDYGPPGQPFENDDEIAAVLGMTPAIAAALRPFVSIYNDKAVDPGVAPAIVQRAWADAGTNQVASQGSSDTVEITAVATLGDGARFARRAVVRFRAGEPFHILAWSRPE